MRIAHIDSVVGIIILQVSQTWSISTKKHRIRWSNGKKWNHKSFIETKESFIFISINYGAHKFLSEGLLSHFYGIGGVAHY